MTRLLSIILLLTTPLILRAQIFPVEGSKLNYRLIGISFAPQKSVNKYTIQIAAGQYNSIDSFNKNIIQTLHSKNNRVLAEVPSFGTQYTWHIIYNKGNKSISESIFHHFSTDVVPDVDTNKMRLRVIQWAEKHKDDYVFMDGNMVLYSMDGKPIWFMPEIEGLKFNTGQLRDLKLSPQGTLTFLWGGREAYEINFKGDVLWKAPNDGQVSGEDSETYHHDFTRLANGNYMVLGSEKVLLNTHPAYDSDVKMVPLIKAHLSVMKKGHYEEETFGTVIEYNPKGKAIWSWKSSDYFKESDIFFQKRKNMQAPIDVHENAFFFDEKKQNVYVSFRNLSRIVKIKYPEGKVINTYGEIYKPNIPGTGNELFCWQHGIKHSEHGYLYLYDNNTCNIGALPKILKLRESKMSEGGLEKIWEYDCTDGGLLDGENSEYDFSSGGSVVELADDCLFVNMSGPYNKIFIVDTDKNILWSAMPEEYDLKTETWRVVSQYRSSIITRKELERLVWNAQLPEQEKKVKDKKGNN